jgi:hypothetical protein
LGGGEVERGSDPEESVEEEEEARGGVEFPDDEEDDDDIVPRSGKRQLMPIERFR